MAQIPLPEPTKPDIYSLGFDKDLSRPAPRVPGSTIARDVETEYARPESTNIFDVDGGHNHDGVNSRLVASFPKTVDVDVYHTPISNVNWNTIAVVVTSVYNAVLDSTGAQNAEVSFNVSLAAGTWQLEFMHRKANNRGIYNIQIDGVNVGTIDGYNVVIQENQLNIVTGIKVAQGGNHVLRFLMDTKNAASAAYAGSLIHVQLQRTA